ncbi:MAG: TolC family protein [Bacteroidetes bacterium]|nr:MAG: TolC family protein [Bacteroidota bacterium]
MKNAKHILFTVVGLICVQFANAQTTLTEQQAIDFALKNSPLLNASTLQIKQHKQLQGTSFNLANPDITLESPTGEFMTVGVLQSFEFPTVYLKQGQLAKQQTVLAEKGKTITEAEVKQQVKTAYLSLQFANQILEQLKKQDSIYFRIADAANRQFEAGQIDFVAKTYAATQYGEVHNNLVQAQTDAQIALQQLQLYTGIFDSIATAHFSKALSSFLFTGITTDSATLFNTPFIQYYSQTQMVAKKSLQLERNKALPGFSFGYMNQGLPNTEIPLRLRAGINIPLWFWQYNSSIKAAKTNLLITEQNTLAQQQNLTAKMQQVKGEAIKFQTSLTYYENTGLKQADDLITSSNRMFSAGQSDYITYLRTLSDAYNIQIKYLETLRNFNQSIINLNYLIGQ